MFSFYSHYSLMRYVVNEFNAKKAKLDAQKYDRDDCEADADPVNRRKFLSKNKKTDRDRDHETDN